MSGAVGIDEVLGSVLWSLENEIAPTVTDQYAVSVCKTSAALLRSCIVRVEHEGAFLSAQLREVQAILAEAHDVLGKSALHSRDVETTRSLPALTAELNRHNAELATVLDELRETADPRVSALREAIRRYLAAQLAGQRPWMVEPFAGEIR